MGFCTVSFLKFLEIQSKLVGIEPIRREGQVHAKYISVGTALKPTI